MTQLFRELSREAYQQNGFWGLVRFFFHTLVDGVASAGTEHLYGIKEGAFLMTKKQHRLILASVGLPLGLILLLAIINPGFVAQLVKPSDAQPIGWILTGYGLLSMGLAYAIQRRVVEKALPRDTSEGLVSEIAFWGILLGPYRTLALGGQRREALLVLGSVLFLVLPTTLIVLFGPVLMMVMRVG